MVKLRRQRRLHKKSRNKRNLKLPRAWYQEISQNNQCRKHPSRKQAKRNRLSSHNQSGTLIRNPNWRRPFDRSSSDLRNNVSSQTTLTSSRSYRSWEIPPSLLPSWKISANSAASICCKPASAALRSSSSKVWQLACHTRWIRSTSRDLSVHI